MALTRAQIIWTTAYVLSMDHPISNDIPIILEQEEPEEEEENESNN